MVRVDMRDGGIPRQVVEWVTKKKKNPIKVHYLGYAASEDRWVGREDVCSADPLLPAIPGVLCCFRASS